MDLLSSYDSAAAAYAEHLASELERKPLDRHILDRFAEEVRGRGRVADLGCGPGHIARYLHDREVEVLGIDISRGMIDVARRLNPALRFEVGDMASLHVADGSFAGAISFYSIVHFTTSQLPAVMAEIRRVLAVDAPLLMSFHVGHESLHVDELFEVAVDLDFVFHEPSVVVDTLEAARFHVTEQTQREPYPGAEYASRRCYLFARAC